MRSQVLALRARIVLAWASGCSHSQVATGLRVGRLHLSPRDTAAPSWLNLAERLFAWVTLRCLRQSSHTAVRELKKALLNYLDRRNQEAKPFVWVADARVAPLCKRICTS